MECFHRFLTRSVMIITVNLEEINVVCVKTFKTSVDSFENVFPAQSLKSIAFNKGLTNFVHVFFLRRGV
jgi:hypothetical protein